MQVAEPDVSSARTHATVSVRCMCHNVYRTTFHFVPFVTVY